MLLPNGHVIPSYMGVRTRGEAPVDDRFTNFALRRGEVREVIYPSDSRSVSKHFVEYLVEVEQSDVGAHGGSTLYLGCIAANTFGGFADKLRYTLRADSGETTREDGIGTGAKVLLLCINGHTDSAIILGGVPDPSMSPPDSQQDGHHLTFEFNGVSAQINKDGEFKLQFRGKTKVDGSLDAPEEAQPTTLEIRKDGSFEVYTKDGQQSICLDHASGKLSVLADNELGVTVNEALKVETGDTAEFDFGDDCTLAIDGSLEIDASGAIDITANRLVTIDSAGVHIGMATENFPKFLTYRTNEQILHANIQAGLGQVAGLVGGAAASIIAASALHTIPIAGPMVAAPTLQAAGQTLLQVVVAVSQMIGAIIAFEAQAPRYLSLFNWND